MAARYNWVEAEADGDGIAGLTLTLHRKSDDTDLGTFTDAGNGNYYIEHSISEKVLIKKSGVVITVTDGMMFPADDVSLATDLISTASGKGAGLIGIYDGSSRFTGETMQAILAELPTLAELASTASGKGAALVGIYDTGGYFSGATVEAALAQIGAITTLLAGLTSTAAELNKLDGASANVTPTNLNTLTGGAAMDAGALHRHDMSELLGNALVGADPSDMNTIVRGQYTALSGQGSVLLDVYHVDGSGKAYVRTGDESEIATLYEIMTAWQVGDCNFSGDPILNNIAFPGKITNAIKLLSQRVMGTVTSLGFNFFYIDSGGTSAGGSDGNEATDPALKLWSESSATEKIKRRRQFTQYPAMRYVRFRGYGMQASGYSGYIYLTIATESYEIKVDGTDNFDAISGYIDLANLPVTVPTEREIQISLKGDGTHSVQLNSLYFIWAEQ